MSRSGSPLGWLRRIATLPLLVRLTQWEPAARVSRSLRAVLVRDRARFVANELRPGQRESCYSLRSGRAKICLRHHTADVLVFDEVFAQRPYDPPDQVVELLGATESPLTVGDLGGNIGLFGAWMLERYPNATITSFEPDPANVVVIRHCIEANARNGQWKLVEACATASTRTLSFIGGQGAVSQIASGEEDEPAIEVPAVDVFPMLGEVDLLKIDIEGGEWELLMDERFASLAARAVVLEYHTHLCPAADPAQAAHDLLSKAGYTTGGRFLERDAISGMVWAWRS